MECICVEQMATTLISITEYLASSYDQDQEYIDGNLEERQLGERDHSRRLYDAVPLLGLGVLAAIVGWAGTPAVRTIQPQQSYSLSQILNQPQFKPLDMHEMRAAPDGVWLMIAARSEPPWAIVRLGLDGQLQRFIDLTQATQASGLAATAQGVATVLQKRGSRHQNFLTEYDFGGGLVSEIAIDCFWVGGLIALGGNATTLCPDGTVTRFSKGSPPVKGSSWYHPGSSVVPLSNHHMVIVDQASAKAVVNELSNNTVTPVTVDVPEVDAALAKIAANTATMSPEMAAHQGRVLVALATASDATGWYMLIGPYHPATGIPVAKFDFTGQLVARMRLQVPAFLSFVMQMVATQDGALVISSMDGDILVYRPRKGE